MVGIHLLASRDRGPQSDIRHIRLGKYNGTVHRPSGTSQDGPGQRGVERNRARYYSGFEMRFSGRRSSRFRRKGAVNFWRVK